MRTLMAIGSYAGPTAFMAAAVLAAAFTAACARFGNDAILRRPSAFFRQWLLMCAMIWAAIMLVSSLLLQRQEGIFDLGSAAGAAAIMGLLTFVFFLALAAKEADLSVGLGIFLLVGGSAAGFVAWFAMFALSPRLSALSGV